ncbi:MAG TPA: hypothetical protein VM142_11870 [Acidimicrobiales bacterium]|nr:hypothetical protein [Acidimicrobiales bacterium]
MTWSTVRLRAPAAELHGRTIEWSRRSATFCEVPAPALVLGSTQPSGDVDSAAVAAAGIDVVRRRSGGGAVLVEPDGMVWADVVVPAADPQWEADVGKAFWWLGDVWASALASLGVASATVHRGGLVRSRWSPMVCFAGLGPGEVSAAGGGKIVGISQRRVRDGALFQCAVPLRGHAAAMARLLNLDPVSRAELEADAGQFGAGLRGLTPSVVEQAFLSHLPTA